MKTRRAAFGALAFLAFPTLAHADRDGEGLSDMRRARDGKKAGETKAPKVEPSDPSAPKPEPKSPWEIGVYGYVRAGYENVQKDARYNFVGQNNGFRLDAALVGIEGGNTDYLVKFRIAAEGASQVQQGINTPLGYLDFRVRDAFLRYDPFAFLGIQLGQFKAAFAEEELRGTQDMLFASRAVGQEGVLVGRGFQQAGVALDRQLGVMLSPAKPIKLGGELHLSYYATLMNGNGSNQMLDDNSRLGVIGRLEVSYGSYVRLGGGVVYNPRTVGTPPNFYDENDLGLSADAVVKFKGLEAMGQFVQVKTTFPTVGSSAQTKQAYHAQLGYTFEAPYVHVTPAYRYAHYHPWAGTGAAAGLDYGAFKVDYHTVGVRFRGEKLPLSLWLNYTFTVEPAARSLDNNRFEAMAQIVF